jgi:hypothetical protein
VADPDPGREPVAAAARAAIAARDWAALTALLHPYLHWDDGARRLRGRTKLLAYLAANGADVAAPSAIEMRDGQIYRWRSS